MKNFYVAFISLFFLLGSSVVSAQALENSGWVQDANGFKTSFGLENMMTMSVSNATVAVRDMNERLTTTNSGWFQNHSTNTPALALQFYWDEVPETYLRNIDVATDDKVTGDVSLIFEQAIDTLIINFDKIGGAAGFAGVTMSNSLIFTLESNNLNLERSSGTDDFIAINRQIYKSAPVTGVSVTNLEATQNVLSGTAAGAVKIFGNAAFDEVQLSFTGKGVEGIGSDLMEMTFVTMEADTTDPDDPVDPQPDGCIVDLSVFLEGAVLESSISTPNAITMKNSVYTFGFLPGQTPTTALGTPTPPGQPYDRGPWNYDGTEGLADDFEYTDNTVDWVLVSVREEPRGADICRAAALLTTAGDVMFPSGCSSCDLDAGTDYYVMVKHRNHMPALSTVRQLDGNGNLSVDLRTEDGLSTTFSRSQKEITTGRFAMYGGNVEQISESNRGELDINAFDLEVLTDSLGVSDRYLDADINFDVFVTGDDLNFFRANNGIIGSYQ